LDIRWQLKTFNPFSFLNTSPSALRPRSLTGMDMPMVALEKKMERLLLEDGVEESAAGQAVGAAVYHLRSGGAQNSCAIRGACQSLSGSFSR
jgi:hypothetical protein